MKQTTDRSNPSGFRGREAWKKCFAKLDGFIETKCERCKIADAFKGAYDKVLIRKALHLHLIREVPAYLLLNFDGAETKFLLAKNSDGFIEGILSGRLSLFNRKYVTPDLVWSVEEFGVLETDGSATNTLFTERTMRRIKTASA